MATAVTDIEAGTVDDWEWTGPTERVGEVAGQLGAPTLAKRAADIGAG
jgi:hypothetical protein